jgi:hypothetical protein
LNAHSSSTPHEMGRLLYKYGTNCGAWINFLLDDDTEVYYEDEDARKPLDNCVGVEVGSIEEGSDESCDPFTLMFPFTEKEWDENIEQLEQQAKFLWERDNSDWFLLEYKGEQYPFRFEAFDDQPIWDETPPKKIAKKVTEWLRKGGNWKEDERFHGFSRREHAFGEWFPLPGTKDCRIMEYENDVIWE